MALTRRVVAASAATSLVLAGCGLGQPEQKAWPKSSSIFDATTALPPTKVTTTTKPAVALPVSGPWVSITSGAFPKDQDGWAYGVEPAPGIAAFQTKSNGELGGCTISFPVSDRKGTVAFLSAGHCDNRNGERLFMYTTGDNSGTLELGDYQQGKNDVEIGAPDVPIPGATSRDYTVLTMGPQLYRGYGTAIVPGIRLRGTMPMSAVRALPAGTTICRHGARTGVTCGRLIQANERDFTWGARSIKGDSGGPVFVVNAAGEALGVGITSALGADGTSSIGTYLDPALKSLGLDLVLA
ncbi:hypothetical protein [Tsukamurella pseudospumae]|uniref:Peptidase S1 domain-containing protein n=1 Tax=Tsukamurella pseudospumae TaxID=239498 RepID=A0A138AE21_9ACTN|nr:hypothetical protein [Tsukamurella pseudospumae]KXP08716.1 hypothetical protein AXK60_08560 [Tsukamurella pseudospumae]